MLNHHPTDCKRPTVSPRRRLLRSMIIASLIAVPCGMANAIDPIIDMSQIDAVSTLTPSRVDWLSVPLPTQLPSRSFASAGLRPRPLPPMDAFAATHSVLEGSLQQPTTARAAVIAPNTAPGDFGRRPGHFVRQPTPAPIVAKVEMKNGMQFDLRATETMSDPDWLGLPVPNPPSEPHAQVAMARPRRLPMLEPAAETDADDILSQGFNDEVEQSSELFSMESPATEDSPNVDDETLVGLPRRLPPIGDLAAEEESPRDFIASAGMSPIASQLDCTLNDFSATPLPGGTEYNNPYAAQWIYDSKAAVPTQAPWIEWGRLFYGDGITPRGRDWFGPYNMVRPQFYLYGDYRTGISAGRNAAGRTDNWSTRLNLDMDLRITDTERFHGFIGPLDRAGKVSGIQLNDGELDYQSVINPNFVTAFFEGDLGAMWGGFHDQSSPMELPFTVGLVPLLFQNGIWMEDAVTGAAFALPARHSRLLNWANYDVTFFAAVDQINSAAFGTDEHAAQAFGNAWFIEAYGGYIETGYAFVRDRNNAAKSYHNMTASFTRRYFDRISNSVRVIVNSGQDLAKDDRTADGGLLLVENSWITSAPLTVVPYANFFYGWGRPQSVARAANSGGILRNTGINFDTDGLNGLATLDPTGADTAGGSIGVDLIGNQLDRQLLIEASYLTEHGNLNPGVDGDQFGLGARYQFPVSNATLLRFDVMHGWRGDLPNVYGTRMEYRWKF